MKHFSISICLILAISSMTTQEVFSQSDETAKPDETSQTESKSDEDNETSSDNEVSETFRPSEDISEDLSVAFPVDI